MIDETKLAELLKRASDRLDNRPTPAETQVVAVNPERLHVRSTIGQVLLVLDPPAPAGFAEFPLTPDDAEKIAEGLRQAARQARDRAEKARAEHAKRLNGQRRRLVM